MYIKIVDAGLSYTFSHEVGFLIYFSGEYWKEYSSQKENENFYKFYHNLNGLNAVLIDDNENEDRFLFRVISPGKYKNLLVILEKKAFETITLFPDELFKI